VLNTTILGHVYGADPAQEDKCEEEKYEPFPGIRTEILREFCHSEPSAAIIHL